MNTIASHLKSIVRWTAKNPTPAIPILIILAGASYFVEGLIAGSPAPWWTLWLCAACNIVFIWGACRMAITIILCLALVSTSFAQPIQPEDRTMPVFGEPDPAGIDWPFYYPEPPSSISPRREDNGALVVCVAVVIVGIGFMGCTMIRACRRIPRPNTNIVEEAASVGYAAAHNMQPCGSCAGEEPQTPAFRVSGRWENGRLVLGFPRPLPPAETMMFHEAAAFFQEHHGVTLDGFAREPWVSYGLNGQPSDPEHCPIRFFPGGTIRTDPPEAGLTTIVIEASDDLRTWTRLTALQCARGRAFTVDDITDKPVRFYRAKEED
jgi:hypothetical protein